MEEKFRFADLLLRCIDAFPAPSPPPQPQPGTAGNRASARGNYRDSEVCSQESLRSQPCKMKMENTPASRVVEVTLIFPDTINSARGNLKRSFEVRRHRRRHTLQKWKNPQQTLLARFETVAPRGKIGNPSPAPNRNTSIPPLSKRPADNCDRESFR